MSIVSPSYSAGSATAITITLAGLITSAGLSTGYRQSTAIDNSTTKYLDVAITGKFKTGTGVTTNGINIYLYGWDGTEYSNNATGTDGAFTPDAQSNLLLIYSLNAAGAGGVTYYLPYIQVAAFCSLSWIPQKWGLIVQNFTGQTFDATAGNFLLEYQGINLSVQ